MKAKPYTTKTGHLKIQAAAVAAAAEDSSDELRSSLRPGGRPRRFWGLPGGVTRQTTGLVGAQNFFFSISAPVSSGRGAFLGGGADLVRFPLERGSGAWEQADPLSEEEPGVGARICCCCCLR